MKSNSWKANLRKSIKFAVGAALAILVSEFLGLAYATTAGVITVLTIRNTKKETLRSVCFRAVSFLCALLIAGVLFGFLGFTLTSFALYLLLHALLCLCLGWGESIAPVAVLVSHFLVAETMGANMVVNESLLLVIGSAFGFLANLDLRKKESEFDRLAEEVDTQIKGILHRMSRWLPREDKSAYNARCFEKLQDTLENARRCAAENYNNVLFGEDTYEVDYIAMRERQAVVLKEIYVNIVAINYLPEQALKVAAVLEEIEKAYHRDNTVEELLQKMEGLLLDMKEQPLPVSREEFEARAILFYILMQIRDLLQIKRDFVLTNANKMPYNHIQKDGCEKE